MLRRARSSFISDINCSSPPLAEAIRIWSGWGSNSWPTRDEARVVERYGAATAAKILPLIKLLENDFYSSDARFIAENLQEMAEIASEQFVQKHPGIDKDIVAALAWCYTFDYK